MVSPDATKAYINKGLDPKASFLLSMRIDGDTAILPIEYNADAEDNTEGKDEQGAPLDFSRKDFVILADAIQQIYRGFNGDGDSEDYVAGLRRKYGLDISMEPVDSLYDEVWKFSQIKE